MVAVYLKATIQYPNATRATPAVKLTPTYIMKPEILPLCNICNPSFAKVENVVKPPQNPVVSNRHN